MLDLSTVCSLFLLLSGRLGGPGTLNCFQYWGSGPLMYCWSWADWTSRVRLRVERLARLRPVLAPSEALAPRRLQPWTGSPALSPRAGRSGPTNSFLVTRARWLRLSPAIQPPDRADRRATGVGGGWLGRGSPRRMAPRLSRHSRRRDLLRLPASAPLRNQCCGPRAAADSRSWGAVAAPNGAAAGLRPSAGFAGGRSGVLVGILRGGPVWRLGTSPEGCRAQAVVRGGARWFVPRDGARSGPIGITV